MALTHEQLTNALTEVEGEMAEAISRTVQASNFSGCLGSEVAPNTGDLLELAACFSIAPISGFNVGAVAVGQSGRVYLGANLEYAGVPLSGTLHAEQSAVLNAWTHGEKAINELHISDTPCGHCRQFLRELSVDSSLKILVRGKAYTLDALLPDAFGERPAPGSGLMDSPSISLSAVKPESNPIKCQAIEAATSSFVPYSQSPEGIVLQCVDGKAYSGCSAESVAFNPSVPPILTALNQRNLSSSRNASITAIAQAKLATTLNHSLPLAKAILKPLTDAPVEVVLMERP